MIDGGDFVDNIDGGDFPDSYFSYNDLTLGITSSYLMDSGNSIYTLISGLNYGTIVETGMFSKFYQLSASNIVNAPSTLENNQLFQLLPSPNYNIYSSRNNIIYSKISNSQITVSGITANGQIETAAISSPGNSSNYYQYYNYIPVTDTITPSQNLLYVYNLNSQESIDIKNYYFQMRTGVTGSNILGINCHIGHSGEVTDTGNYITNIRWPIHRYIITGGKPIKYVCLLHGIPTRITGSVAIPSGVISCSVAYDLSASLMYFSGYSRGTGFQYLPYVSKNTMRYSNSPNINRPFLLEEYSGNTALFCHIGSLQGRTADVSGYIRKICQNGIVSGVYLVGSGQNTTFLCYSNDGSTFTGTTNIGQSLGVVFDRSTDFYTGLGVNIFISKPISTPINMTGSNLGGFTSNGTHGNLYLDGTGTTVLGNVGDNWESNPTKCSLSGYNWYISSHYESYGGNMLIFDLSSDGREMTHSCFSKQIKPNSMGGTAYSNIPVGFVGSMIEPLYDGIEKVQIFDAWFNGRPFIEAAYMGLNSVFGNPSNHPTYAVMGDPLTKWR